MRFLDGRGMLKRFGDGKCRDKACLVSAMKCERGGLRQRLELCCACCRMRGAWLRIAGSFAFIPAHSLPAAQDRPPKGDPGSFAYPHSGIRPLAARSGQALRKEGTGPSKKKSPITDHRLPITDHRSPITDYRLPITDYRSLIFSHVFLKTGTPFSKFSFRISATFSPGYLTEPPSFSGMEAW